MCECAQVCRLHTYMWRTNDNLQLLFLSRYLTCTRDGICVTGLGEEPLPLLGHTATPSVCAGKIHESLEADAFTVSNPLLSETMAFVSDRTRTPDIRSI